MPERFRPRPLASPEKQGMTDRGPPGAEPSEGAIPGNDDTGTPPAAAEEPWPPRRHAWWALGLLMAGIVVSCLDRAIVNLLVEPIRAEFGLSDTQFGALQSIAFGMFYVSMSIPLGILADRYQRRIVIAVGVGLFSLFSLFTGMARSYWQLFAARMGVGFGEASLSPAGFSMLGDYFPPHKLGRAISMFTMSNFIGTSFAYVVGGALIGLFDRVSANDPGALLGLAPWQATIVAISVPGFFLAPLLFMMREPPRRGLVGNSTKLGWRETFAQLRRFKAFLLLMLAGMSMASIMTHAVSMWTPALFIRVYGWTATEVGFWFGALLLAGSVLGSLLGGFITDWLTGRDNPGAPLAVAAFSFIGVGIFGVAAPLMPTPMLALACMAPVLFLKPMAFACAPIALQLVVPNQLRAQVSAGYLTTINLVGLGLGPVMVGLASDMIFPGAEGIRYAMVLITAVTVPLMVILVLLSIRPYRILRA